MVLEFINLDAVVINVDPETVERVVEAEAANVSHLVVGGMDISVVGHWRDVAALVEKARGTPCVVRLIPPHVEGDEGSGTETAELPRAEDDVRAEKPHKKHK